ncbi:unnamed protein product [Urochloa humidicola]
MRSPARQHHLGRLAAAALVLAAALLLAAAVPGAMAEYSYEETEHEEEFSYARGNEHGPEHWGEIKPEWAACGAGQMQSPIDLHHERVSLERGLGYLDHSYRPAQASIINRGHDIMMRFESDAGSLVINGTAYKLKQLHWHSPTEHTVDGRRYDLELHLVHESAENKTAVIGILYQIGRGHDPLLRQMEPFIRRIADKRDREERVGVVDPRAVRGRASVYYRYMGSLTVPPCTEGVIWTIIKRVHTVSKQQMELLKEAVHDDMEENARPLQELKTRDVSLFRPSPNKHY